MKYYRYKDSFYKVLSETPQKESNLILIEYNEKVGKEMSDLFVTLPNGNIGALINVEIWKLESKEIPEIDYCVWRHIGAPNGKGD